VPLGHALGDQGISKIPIYRGNTGLVFVIGRFLAPAQHLTPYFVGRLVLFVCSFGRFILDLPLIHSLLKPAHFLNDSHKAETEGREAVLHLDRRLLTKDRTLQNTEPYHLAQTLVHHLRGQPRARPKNGAWPIVTFGA